MIGKLLTYVLVVALLNMATAPAFGKSKAEEAARVKAAISKMGVGESARVTLKLRDRTKLSGYVSEAGEEEFSVVEAGTGRVVKVAYLQVKSVKGHNLSTGAKVAIGTGIALAAAVVLYFVINGANDR